MARECFICAKRKATGNNVSHSKRHTRRTFGANLHKMDLEQNGEFRREYICTRCSRTQKTMQA